MSVLWRRNMVILENGKSVWFVSRHSEGSRKELESNSFRNPRTVLNVAIWFGSKEFMTGKFHSYFLHLLLTDGYNVYCRNIKHRISALSDYNTKFYDVSLLTRISILFCIRFCSQTLPKNYICFLLDLTTTRY